MVVIGGGAAGFFGAIRAAEASGGILKVTIIEKTGKLLSKVKVSGGGRCNITNLCEAPVELSTNYPRGNKKLVQAFKLFGSAETKTWFERHGLEIKTEPDGRVFPKSNSSQSVIDLFLQLSAKLNINIINNNKVISIIKNNDVINVKTDIGVIDANYVIIAAGGNNKRLGYSYLSELGLNLNPPIPSLFTFNIKDQNLHKLAGVSVSNAQVKLARTKFIYNGPLLITHWGLSGPAVLKTSAFGAVHLFNEMYTTDLMVNWSGIYKEQELAKALAKYQDVHPKRSIGNYPLFDLPSRLWLYLLSKAQINESLIWQDAGKKQLNPLKELLYGDRYKLEGKTTFKEEFVTCGGIDLSEVNKTTFELYKHPNIYAAGEVLDIDGVTGGFNFQAAWTTSYLVGTDIAKKVTGVNR